MREHVLDLRDVSEFRQTLAARPPGIVHGTAVTLILLVTGALIWAGVTKANVVVRAAARVRPADAPLRGFDEVSTEHVHAEVGGRIAAIDVTEGQTVASGAVLVQLDTARVDNAIAELSAELNAKRGELAALDRMIAVLGAQAGASERRGEAEVRRSERSVSHSRQRRRSDRRMADVELDEAAGELARAERAAAEGVGSAAEVDAARARLARARARVTAADVGVDDGEPEVLRRALDQARSDAAFKAADLDRQRAVLAGAIAAGEKQLANLELDRDHATLRAHRQGVVTLGGLAAGDTIAPGKLPLAIVDDGALRVDAAIRTVDIGEVRVGMRVRVKVDALDVTRYGAAAGVITHLGADTAQTAGGAAYYLASITLDSDTIGRGERRGHLRPGMTGELEVITDRQPLLVLLVRSLRGAIGL